MTSRRGVLRFAAAASVLAVAGCDDQPGNGGAKPASSAPPGPPIDVREQGARGDGASDDTRFIQTALNRAGDGGTVYFPAGVYRISKEARSSFLTIGPRTRLLGDGMNASVLKPVDRSGPWRSFLGLASSARGAGTVSVQGIGFDMNTRTNPVVGDPVRAGAPRWVLDCVLGDSGVVEVVACAFRDCSNVNTLYLAGRSVVVKDCEFVLTGAQTGGSWDHSSVYASSADEGSVQIVNNTFSGILGGPGSRTAIETHGGSQQVTGNRVSSYMVGMNITGVSRADTVDVAVGRNQVLNALIGVQLWSRRLDAASPARMLRTVSVEGNEIVVAPDSWRTRGRGVDASATGILLNIGDQSSIDGLRIESNHIAYLASRSQGRPADVRASGIAMTAGRIKGLIVRGNTIHNPLSSAILLIGDLEDVLVNGNAATNPASGNLADISAPYRAMTTLGGRIRNLTVRDNHTIDNRVPQIIGEEVSRLAGLTVTGDVLVQARAVAR